MSEFNETASSERPIFELLADPKATQTLPSLGSIVTELTHMMGQAHAPIQGISNLIRRDQSMSVRILRLANSAYFAPAQPLLNIEEALIYLGLNQVRSSILTARCIEKTLNVPSSVISWKEFWNHSVAVACLCRTLGARLKNPEHAPETFYMMGLLHDIGKLALAHLSPKDFAQAIKEAKETNSDMSSVEFRLMGIDHAGLGAWYLQQQGLPSSVSETVRLHHSWNVDPEKGSHASLVSLANRYTHNLAIGDSGSEYTEKVDVFSTDEWAHYAGLCQREPDDDLLIQYVSSEAERLPVLVGQLTA